MERKKKVKKAEVFSEPLLDQLRGGMNELEGKKIETRMAISAKIGDIMEEKGISKSDLAYLTGKTKSQITRWLSGVHNFTCDTLVEIGFALQEDIVSFYEEEPKKHVYRTSINIIPKTTDMKCNTNIMVRSNYFQYTETSV